MRRGMQQRRNAQLTDNSYPISISCRYQARVGQKGMTETGAGECGLAASRDQDIAAQSLAAASMPVPWRSPTRWIIACGVLLIVMIAIGTAMMVAEFRDRALQSTARELSNTVLLVSRHFDQQFDGVQAVLNQAADALSGFGGSSEDRQRALASEETHLLLKSKTHGFGGVGTLNIYDGAGTHVNSSHVWPVARFDIADATISGCTRSRPATRRLASKSSRAASQVTGA